MSSQDLNTPEDGAEEGENVEIELDLFSQLQEASKASDEDLEEDSGEVTLEQLSASYAEAIQNAEGLPEDMVVMPPNTPGQEGRRDDEAEYSAESPGAGLAVIGLDDSDELPEAEDSEEEEQNAEVAVTPASIVETMLFVGCPDNAGLTASQLAKTMRGVSAKEVDKIVQDLNTSFAESGRALRVLDSPDGYRMDLAEDLEVVRDRFYGQQREITLNQAAIDCLALVAYQPGISRDKLEEQRSQPSGGVLNQLVRRQLLEMKRKKVDGRNVACYYPTEKMLELAGLYSIEDLPQVEDLD
ncbi:MAG: SMC-Scp complex subunit ScpB [Aureliella sp.]